MKAAADTIPVHKSCYAVLKKECASHDIFAINIRLWAVAAFRKPWNNSQPLFLPYPTNVDISLIETVVKEIGMPQLLDMPAEVVGMIQGYSERSLFWRSVAARSLATYISETIDQPLEFQTTPLTEIMDWKRGSAVTSTSPKLLPPFVTITIDSDGIRSISRQGHPSEYSIGRSTSTTYIVLSQDDEMLSKLDVHNMYGRCRLVVPPDMEPPRIWNTPTPPAWSSCNMSINGHDSSRKWPRLTAVNLDGITGITFFLDLGSLASIHLHYPGEPSAMDTYNKMGSTLRSFCVWIYVPISKDDQVTAIGVKRDLGKPFSLFIQTEKSGDIIVGPHNESFKDNCFVHTAPLTFIYQQLKQWDTTNELGFVGTYSAGEPARKMEEDFPVDRYERSPLSLHSFVETIYFSWAPLEGVASAVVYKRRHKGVTRGIILHYLNGGSRALGQCRVGVDVAQEVFLPIMICIKIASRWDGRFIDDTDSEDGEESESPWQRRTVHSARVEFQSEPEHEHPAGEQWCCKPMADILKFWCMIENTFCTVRDGTEVGPIPGAATADLHMLSGRRYT
ncbi:hypothetical protein M441DRAFT_23399 [Trichoderma asperellum CBS 433.97]|uniref:Uncharacterized protein n=1 Tax=Trichoderma asperellum (strain ATCC 204424 / CBS 433.97 / NBRC 101777) TaxID=1042311 RepID=A0A2T3ZJZ1_TRIA4|nr:hypothetical protein M441DRAFT_23399 [Trichoderma asperellum CBS 433.97]PTB45128.1 hypothetical protein M441DRAFT_23399 [Trichoderma asperellum CBS 433.97]